MKQPPSELMADMGHSWKHAPQQTHMSLLILATFFEFIVSFLCKKICLRIDSDNDSICGIKNISSTQNIHTWYEKTE